EDLGARLFTLGGLVREEGGSAHGGKLARSFVPCQGARECLRVERAECPMNRKYDVAVTDGIVRIAIRGAFTGARGADAVAMAVRKAGEAGTSLILFDIRGFEHPAYH